MLGKRKFLIDGKAITVIAIILFCLLLAGAVLVCVFNIVAGMCIVAVLLIICFCILWRNPIIITFSSSCIQTKTFFGKVKKLKYWSDLKRIVLKELFTGGRGLDNYCIFIFTDKEINFRSYEEAEQEEQVILMSYRKELKGILENYTEIDIENNLICKKDL